MTQDPTVPGGLPPLLIAGHGTRSAAGVAEFTRFTERVGSRAGERIPAVAGGFIELARPSVADAVTRHDGNAMTSGHRETICATSVGPGDFPDRRRNGARKSRRALRRRNR